MWMKRIEVLNYVNNYMGDITLNDLFLLSKNIKIEASKEMLQKQILQHSNGDIATQIDYYDKFVKALKIYAKKSFQISYLLKMIVGEVPFSQTSLDELDITIDDEKVLKSDIDRLVFPLKHIYNLMKDIKEKAENFSTYISEEEIEFVMPKTGVLNLSSSHRFDEVNMTRKQVQKKMKQRAELTKMIFEKYHSTHNAQD